MPVLRYTLDGGPAQEIDLGTGSNVRSRISIGRATENDIVLSHARASRYHCAVTWYPGCWAASDSTSVLGTTVNQVALDPFEIRKVGKDDVIGAGAHSIMLTSLPELPSANVTEFAGFLNLRAGPSPRGQAEVQFTVRWNNDVWSWSDRSLSEPGLTKQNYRVLLRLLSTYENNRFDWLSDEQIMDTIGGRMTQAGASDRRHQVHRKLRRWWEAQVAHYARMRAERAPAGGGPLPPELPNPMRFLLVVSGRGIRLGIDEIVAGVRVDADWSEV